MSRLASTTLRIGELAPDFTLLALDGSATLLSSILKGAHALLVFAPGSWSPATRSQIEQLAATCDLFNSMNVKVVVVLSQDLAAARRAFVGNGLPLIVLVDPTREVARDYGVYRAFSRDGIGVCRPATFLIERSGIIRFAYVGGRDDDTAEADTLLLLATWLVPARISEPQEVLVQAEEEEAPTVVLDPVSTPPSEVIAETAEVTSKAVELDAPSHPEGIGNEDMRPVPLESEPTLRGTATEL
ncbi:MAG: hypothetical protein QOF51_2265 [Chloroflexota bacterium]|nr:hypothetical protein [Chloroflexota bacterium]